MELSTKQQIVEAVRVANKILILTHQDPDGDALGSMIALALILKKINKDVTAVTIDKISDIYNFMPVKETVTANFSYLKDFVISVDTSKTKVDKLGYKNIAAENKLNIVITPTSGTFKAEDVSFSKGNTQCDLIIVLDCPDLERLGAFYDQNTELFFETPVINIDHHAGNDYFGKINWVDLTATSTAEILVALIESLAREKPLIDVDVATALLTGIIVDTGSFQNINTTPKSFTVAAQLVAAGAKQQEIIRSIFKTKSLSTLKLWGKILSNVTEEQNSRFVWSKITAQDYLSTGADEGASAGIIDELLKTAPGIDFALLISEKSDGVHGSMRSANSAIDVSAIAKLFSGGGHAPAAAFHLPGKKLSEVQDEILTQIRKFQRNKAN
jgi:bifunctional oligoribonuclease and PAP phosphatase NrnA